LLFIIFIAVMVVTLFALIIIDGILRYDEQTPTAASLTNEEIAALSIIHASVYTEDDPRIGNPDAPLVIVAFEDFACPFCKQSFPIIREVLTEYADEVLFVFRDFPLDDIHPTARIAAEAAECAHEQGKFWEYHDRLFQNQGVFDTESLIDYGIAAGLDPSTFASCVDLERYRSEVEADVTAGTEAGVEGTPTFFFNGMKFEGTPPREAFIDLIEFFINV